VMIPVGVFLVYVCLSVSLSVFVWFVSYDFYTFIISVELITIGGQH